MSLFKKRADLGQSLIETVVVIKLVTVFIYLICCILYFVYSNQITDFFSQRALLCLEIFNKKEKVCEKELKSSLNRLLFFHKNVEVKVLKKRTQNKTIVKASIFKGTKTWTSKLKKLN